MQSLHRFDRCAQSRSHRASPCSSRSAVVARVFSNWPMGKNDKDDAPSQKNPGPPDAPKRRMQEPREIIAEGREWLSTILSRFGPIKERAQTVTTLDFEKPLLELDKRIEEVNRVTNRTLRWLAR